jgi:hypothetical protein
MLARTNGWRIAAIVSLATIGACGGAGQIEDTPEMRAEIAREIVRLEIEAGDLDQRLDRGADLAQAYSLDTIRLELGRELTDRELERVREIMRSVLGEFLTAELWEGILVEVYVEHFTASELKAVADFFGSPAGSKVLRLSAQLSEEIDARSDTYFEGKLDAFVARIDEELGEAFPALQEGGS